MRARISRLLVHPACTAGVGEGGTAAVTPTATPAEQLAKQVRRSDAVRDVNACKHPRRSPNALLTLYPRVGHSSWDRTYDPASRFNPATAKPRSRGVNVYEWLLTHRRTAVAK